MTRSPESLNPQDIPPLPPASEWPLPEVFRHIIWLDEDVFSTREEPDEDTKEGEEL